MTTLSASNFRPMWRILCIDDDDDDDASLFETAVNSNHEGICFMKCYGGQEALDFLKAQDSIPDLILLDVNMPVVNGFDCLREIRKNPTLESVPVFMLSTSGSPKDVSLALELGAKKFLTKPNSYSQIISMMMGIIEECLIEK